MKSFGYFILCVFFSLSSVVGQNHITVKGKITSENKSVENVAVTDGWNVVWTNQKGEYIIETMSDRDFIYYSCPSGFNSPIYDGVPVFYSKIDTNKKSQTIDFELMKSVNSQYNHSFIAWADPQIIDIQEFDLLDKVVSDVNKEISNYANPVHAISLGDNVFDKMEFFKNYKKVISKINIPFYQVLGNHDMDYNERSNELSNKSFTKEFGPSHYSYNVGEIHYITLKNVFYTGYSYRYIGYLDENQLKWLEKDISKLKEGQTVVISLHIPTKYGDSEKPTNENIRVNSLLNAEALYKIIEPFNVHILAGHSHTQWNTQIRPNILEHTHAAASAAWWQGEVGLDGTPKGYTIYEASGNKLKWKFKGVGLDKSEQFKVYTKGDTIIANVFNYDDLWKVELYENGKFLCNMERYWGKDPLAEQLYVPGTNKRHWWLGVGTTFHLFRAIKIDKKKRYKIQVTDRFGDIYTKTIK